VIFAYCCRNDDGGAFVYPSAPAGPTHGLFLLGGGNFGDTSANYITIMTPANSDSYYSGVSGGENSGCSISAFSRGVFNKGQLNYGSSDDLYYISVYFDPPTQASLFGNLTVARRYTGTASNHLGDRGVWMGGTGAGTFNTMDYITMSTLGDAADFGDLTNTRLGNGGSSNNENQRGLITGGLQNPTYLNVIEYITINTLGNSIDFGDLTEGKYGAATCANGKNERSVACGGILTGGAVTNVMEYSTINTLGNAIDFGDIVLARGRAGYLSNFEGERGVICGGAIGSTKQIMMDYFTINTPGNASDFGDVDYVRAGSAGVVS
jgi:hypothetical protein